MQGDWLLFLKAFMKFLALQHLRDRVFGHEPNEIFRGELGEPTRIEIHYGFVGIEHFEDLGFVGFCIAVDVLARERGTSGRSSGGVTDHSGKVPDQKDYSMPQVLEMLYLAQ